MNQFLMIIPVSGNELRSECGSLLVQAGTTGFTPDPVRLPPPEAFQSISQFKYSFFFQMRATLLAAEVCVAVSISSSAAGHVTRHPSAGTCSGRPGNARLHQTAFTHVMRHI